MKNRDQLFDLSGKTALVTGASSGLGAHFAKVLAANGADVIVAARREERLQTLCNDITAAGGKALAITLDVSNGDSVKAAFERLQQHDDSCWHCPDIICNNAGTAESELFLDMDEDNWDQVMDTNLKGIYLVSQAAAKALKQQEKAGSIINTASILGLAVQMRQSSYATSKAGAIQLTKMMALELNRFNIRVNAIAPGYFKTEMNTDFLNSPIGEKYVANTLPQRVGDLEELNGALLLLASNASTFINGSVINVDGGTLLKGL